MAEPIDFRDRVTITLGDDGVADVQMTRVDKRNALDSAMFNALAEAGEELKAMPGVRAAVISGQGKSFCAGLDFGSFEQMAGGGGVDTPAGERPARGVAELTSSGITHLGQQVCWVWQEVPVPVIAAVHGHALGGGLQVALGADLRFVHPDTKLSVREVHWGLTPDMTATLFLSRLVRPDVAKELIFTARLFSGTEAGEIGVATRVTEAPHEDALALARQIAAMSPDAVRGAKLLCNRVANAGAAEQFAAERDMIGSLMGTPNQVEAITANFENRPPRFS